MSFLAEMKRRKVFRVGAAYAVAAWGLAQIADLVLANRNLGSDLRIPLK